LFDNIVYLHAWLELDLDSVAGGGWWLGFVIFTVAFGAFELLSVVRSIKNFTVMGTHSKNCCM